MLKFFSRIRRKLLDEGNLKRYLIYAIGEILLVMGGILLALQVNNWNENNKNREAEYKALLDLKYEFENNIERLEFICKSKENTEIKLRTIIESIANNSLNRIIKPDILGMPWDATNSVLTSLINSGDIEHIENDSLKYLLTDWTVLVKRWETREAHFMDVSVQRLNNYLESRMTLPIPMQEERNNWVNYYPNSSNIELDNQSINLTTSIQYQNLIASIVGELWIQSIICSDILQGHNKILGLLNNEIELRS